MEITKMKVEDIVQLIIESADEVRELPSKSDFEMGQLLAYATCLSIIRDEFILEQEEIGLGFDIDQRYFGKGSI